MNEGWDGLRPPGGNARTRVFDREADPVLPGFRRELDHRVGTPAHGVLGIGHEVDDDLLQLLTQAEHRFGSLIHVRAHFDIVGAEHALANLRDVAHQVVELDPHGRDIGATGQAQQAPHDAGGAINFPHDRGGGGAGFGVLG